MNAKFTKEPELAIRFLRQGFVPVEKKPTGFDHMTEDEMKQWGANVLDQMKDKELLASMAYFSDPEKNGYFDEAPSVQAIQDPEDFDTVNENIFSTTAWDAFTDPDFGENIIQENKSLANFLATCGFDSDQISNISYESPLAPLEKLKVFDTARRAALEEFRQAHSKQLVEKIKNDAGAPQLLKELIDEKKITDIGFERVVHSPEYMPDHCVYVYLSGECLIGIRTEDQSSSYAEVDYTHGDYDIEDGNSFLLYVNDYDLIERDVSDDEAIKSYEYLTNIVDTLEDEDLETFRDYLLER